LTHTKPQRHNDIEALAKTVVDCGFQVHKQFGPGLLESVDELVLLEALRAKGLAVERQREVPITFNDVVIDRAFRADLVVEQTILIELKSTEQFAPVHGKQVLTYLRLLDLPLGYVMNFGMYSYKEGVRRIANNYFPPRT
jgi:GxxExxY protein